MSENSHDYIKSSIEQKPTRRGLISLLSAGVGLALGTQLNRAKHGEVSLEPVPKDAQAYLKSPTSTMITEGKKDPDIQIDFNPHDFIIHGRSPLTFEAKRHTIGTSVITHEKHLFIRNNLPMPSREITLDPEAWSIDIKGVKNSRSITVAELKTLGLHTVTAVLQCSGNGRAFYTHGPSGSQWSTGAAGCLVWSGVKLSDVIEHLGGIQGTPHYLTSTGGDPLPEGVDPLAVIVERSIPIEKAMKDALLAWEMNGAEISLEHGGPLRLIVPGYFGCNQIKYVKQLAFTVEQTQSKIQKAGYRLRPIGEAGSPDQPSMWEMPVKSWLTNEETVFGDRQILRGVAMGGERSVSKVEISIDGGKTWKEAPFVGPDLGPFAWRLFQLTVNLPQGDHQIVCRAFDDKGETQPEKRLENERGYGHNGWRDHALTMNVKPLSDRIPLKSETKATESVSPQVSAPSLKPKAKILSEQAKRGKEVYLKDTLPQCGVCHTLEDAGTKGAVGPQLDQLKPKIEQVKNAVSKGLGAMPAQKHLTEQQINDLAQYIVEATQ